ncbi:LOW QUALITY PROTEIN: hypothetical protein U9M48_022423 [Paspalum notatum var. saurae]|uniref:Uncharacterized protein n=1 Tax=Paspalum notatum var. saurae TaxID=547442 RepID=A0AAQ3WV54_PASNO
MAPLAAAALVGLLHRCCSGELLGALGLGGPIRASDHQEHAHDAGGLRREEAEPEALEVVVVPEGEDERDGRADEVEGAEVDAGGVLGPGAAPQHAAAGGLRAVAELAGAEDGQHGGGECDDGRVGREHGGPGCPHEAGERRGHAAEGEAEHEADGGGAGGVGRAVGAELVADARGDAEAERGGKDVDEGGGLDEDAHAGHGGLRVGEQAAEEDHDLVPPPLEADADAAGQREAEELAPAAEAVGREGEAAGAPVHAREEDVGEEEEDEVEVGEHGGQCDARDAEAEHGDEHVVDGQVERDGERGAEGERQVDGLRAEVDADGVEDRLQEQVREGRENVGLGDGGDAGVLAAEQEQRPHVRPEAADGHGGGEEHQHGALRGDAEEVVVARPDGLAADGLHAHGESREHGVSRDVGEADGEGAACQRQPAEAAEEEHGDHGAERSSPVRIIGSARPRMERASAPAAPADMDGAMGKNVTDQASFTAAANRRRLGGLHVSTGGASSSTSTRTSALGSKHAVRAASVSRHAAVSAEQDDIPETGERSALLCSVLLCRGSREGTTPWEREFRNTQAVSGAEAMGVTEN